MPTPPRSLGSVRMKARSSYIAQRILLPAQQFFHTETTSGLVLLAAAIASLIWANSPYSGSYEHLWHVKAGFHFGFLEVSHSLREWINSALMVVFFFVVGLEVKHEFVHGELSDLRRASLPLAGALGGMLVPAALYSFINVGMPGARGWGIPMATDIAFALGVLALAGKRMPQSGRTFLLALATVDDIGAVLVIALFYTGHLSAIALIWALVLIALIIIMQKLGLQNLTYYFPMALLFWFAVLESGVHATIAGVVLGLLTPADPYFPRRQFAGSAHRLLQQIHAADTDHCKDTEEVVLGEMEELTIATEAPAARLIRLLHPWSSYVILPIFALANAGVAFTTGNLGQALSSPVTRGVVLGLVIGKVLGIIAFTFAAVRSGIATLLQGLGWTQLVGIGLLAGIGFTVSLFIADLAFTEERLVSEAKIGVLTASTLAGAGGWLLMRFAHRGKQSGS
jgi:NhaA family Na+:H+ antiporter